MFVDAAYFADFGVDALIDGASVRGILDIRREHIEYGLEEVRPAFICRKADVPAAAAELMIGIDTYAINAVRDDGTGLVELMLTGPQT